MTDSPHTPAPPACRCRSWHLAAASYACLPAAVVLSLAAGNASCAYTLHAVLSVLFSAVSLLGLTLLVAAAAMAFHACCRRPEVLDVVSLLLTLPPIILHVLVVLAV